MPLRLADIIEKSLLQAVSRRAGRMVVAGICGAQGSGKSTVAAILRNRLIENGLRAATMSIDDFYLPLAAREELARSIHPLLRTRGVPGTHDVTLAESVLTGVSLAGSVRCPKFDKAADTRSPQSAWDVLQGPLDIVLLEGWFIGARPQAESALIEPVNDLEREEDTDGRWRTWVNLQLATEYQRLFARLDTLILIEAPSFDVVLDWRLQQEQDLRRACGPGMPGVMNAISLRRFVAHFQRLTTHILAELPPRADLVVRLDRQRRVLSYDRREVV